MIAKFLLQARIGFDAPGAKGGYGIDPEMR
jgi:hypothetical protein